MPKAGGEVRSLRARGGFAPIRVHSRFLVARRRSTGLALKTPRVSETLGVWPRAACDLTPSFPLSACGEGDAKGWG